MRKSLTQGYFLQSERNSFRLFPILQQIYSDLCFNSIFYLNDLQVKLDEYQRVQKTFLVKNSICYFLLYFNKTVQIRKFFKIKFIFVLTDQYVSHFVKSIILKCRKKQGQAKRCKFPSLLPSIKTLQKFCRHKSFLFLLFLQFLL